LVPARERWLLARLAFAPNDLVEGEAISDYAPTLASAAVITTQILIAAVRLIASCAI
jgi:hypothetical protein